MIIRNKSQLITPIYTQIEGINFEETFALVVYLESMRLLIGMAFYFGFVLYQMDVKIAFINEVIKEEFYVK